MTWRRPILVLWAAVSGTAVYVYVAHRAWLQVQLSAAFAQPSVAASLVLLVLGALRGFTLIPSTALVLVALPFFRPATLLGLTIAGIVLSSTSLYFCSGLLGFGRGLERRHGEQIARLRAVLTRHEVPIIIGWSVFPLVPTDLICYVCGAMRVNFWKFLAGVTFGEGVICAAYIYGGDQLLRWLELR